MMNCMPRCSRQAGPAPHLPGQPAPLARLEAEDLLPHAGRHRDEHLAPREPGWLPLRRRDAARRARGRLQGLLRRPSRPPAPRMLHRLSALRRVCRRVARRRRPGRPAPRPASCRRAHMRALPRLRAVLRFPIGHQAPAGAPGLRRSAQALKGINGGRRWRGGCLWRALVRLGAGRTPLGGLGGRRARGRRAVHVQRVRCACRRRGVRRVGALLLRCRSCGAGASRRAGLMGSCCQPVAVRLSRATLMSGIGWQRRRCLGGGQARRGLIGRAAG